MKKHLPTFLFIFLATIGLIAQDTFSIMAVDPETGEVGAAGASCIDDGDCGGCGGVIIINDLIPGRGGMNSQAYACIPNVNLQNGIAQLEAGDSPQEALDYVLANDACFSQGFDPTYRQYGIVDLDPATGDPRSVAYTGSNNDPYANHLTGPNYAIQGNILLGQEILDSMEARFLSTEGSLAEKLMAAMQGANVPGADTRCLNEDVSSLSAFIRVAQPGDTLGTYYLELNVKETPFGVEPIDSLQTLFDSWFVTNVDQVAINELDLRVYPNPSTSSVFFESSGVDLKPGYDLTIYNEIGQKVLTKKINATVLEVSASELTGSQLYWYRVENEQNKIIKTGKFIHLK